MKANLRERGIRVKKKDLVKFFCFIEEKCPWLILTRQDIHPLTWERVGKDINVLLKTGEEIPDTFFSYYGIVRDILRKADSDQTSSHLLALAEDFLSSSCCLTLKSETKHTLPPPGAVLLINEPIPSTKTLGLPLQPEKSKPKVYKTIYPVIPCEEPPNEGLDLTSEADLGEEVASLETERYDLPLPPHTGPMTLGPFSWNSPPPYPTVPPLVTGTQGNPGPALLGAQEMLQTKAQLLKQVSELREVLTIRKEMNDLVSQIQALHTDLVKKVSSPAPVIRLPSPLEGQRHSKHCIPRAEPRYAFPVVTPAWTSFPCNHS